MNKKTGLVIIAVLVISTLTTLIVTNSNKMADANTNLLVDINKSDPSARFYAVVSQIIFITSFHKEFLSTCVRRTGITKLEMDKVVSQWSIRNKKYVDLAWATKGLDENNKDKQKYFAILTQKKIKATTAINNELKKKKTIIHVCKHQLKIVRKGDYDLGNYPILVKYFPESLTYLNNLKKTGKVAKTQFNVY